MSAMSKDGWQWNGLRAPDSSLKKGSIDPLNNEALGQRPPNPAVGEETKRPEKFCAATVRSVPPPKLPGCTEEPSLLCLQSMQDLHAYAVSHTDTTSRRVSQN